MKYLLFVFWGGVAILSGCSPEHIQTSTLGRIQIPDDKPTPEPTFEYLNANLFQLRCVKCHSGESPKGFVDLSSYQSMLKGFGEPPVLSPGQPESSRLYLTMISGAMPEGGPVVSEELLELTRLWIQNGAVNK